MRVTPQDCSMFDQTFPVRREGLVKRELGDEVLLFEPQSGAIHYLDPISAFVWERCDRDHSVKAIASEISAVLEVRYEQVLIDVEQLLKRWKRKQIVTGLSSDFK